jgi:hypothetical protein
MRKREMGRVVCATKGDSGEGQYVVDLGEGRQHPMAVLGGGFLEHSFLETRWRRLSLGGAEAALEVKGRRRHPSWDRRAAADVEAYAGMVRRRPSL